MTINYMSIEEILRIHYQLIEDFGGSHGVRDEKRLASVIAAPKQTVFKQEQYKSIFEKAAVYLRNIIGDHPFVDGNKRTAITVCGIFLERNKQTLQTTPSDLESFVISVATDHLDIPTIARWLETRSK